MTGSRRHDVAIVGGGIGREIVRSLTADGVDVIGVDLTNDLVAAAADAAAQSGSFLGFAGNIARFQSAEEATQLIGGRRLRGLVNCAGRFSAHDFEELSEESWLPMLESNLVTTIAMCRAVLPRMRDQRGGSMVNFASTAGEYGSIRPAALYAAAKGSPRD